MSVDYVNPWIGSIGHLLTATSPVVMLPHGMAQISPLYTPGVTDIYLADKIVGFPLNASSIMADTERSCAGNGAFTSGFDHDHETMKCYSGHVFLEDSGIDTEYTVSERCLYYRFSFRPESTGLLRITAKCGHEFAPHNNVSLEGFEVRDGVKCFFIIEFSAPWSSLEIRDGYALLRFAGSQSGVLEARAGLSYIGCEQARMNFDMEVRGRTFEETKAAAKTAWDRALGRIEVSGGTASEKTKFYTALYRVMGRMVNITEYGRYFSAYDGKVHDAQGHDFYVNDGIWDTYRCAHPLQLILEPSRQVDMIRSYLRMYEQSGWLPSFPMLSGSAPVMLGKHAAAMILDAWSKGVRDFDIGLAYEAMKKNADEATKLPWALGPINAYDACYFEKGFFPALPEGEVETLPAHAFEKRQCVSVTLETAYDDWCLAQVAKELGQEEDYKRFSKRAVNYRNLYNPETGFMSPKTEDGRWVKDFDPKYSGGQGGRDYFAECNSWVYTWHVQHDIQGLIGLMGGKQELCRRLDALFIEQYDSNKYTFLRQFPDATGLIGQYCQGNEPAFHIPYLYNYGGQPWKTQRRVREIMRLWYGDGPMGVCGDEDGGAMSAWYVFSAMGFYPVCPGRPEYDLGSPLFDETMIHLEDGKTFVIRTTGNSARNKYIQEVRLNGRIVTCPRFSHTELAVGGELELQMGLSANAGAFDEGGAT